jgi:hypothetical protein
MGGLARFLLGCAVGVALGILISRKRAEKIPAKSVQPLSQTGMAPVEPQPESQPEPQPEPEAEAAPEQAFELPSVDIPEFLEEPLPEAGEEPFSAAPDGPVAADDLRTRIEETRRRIRMELDEPFATPSAGVAAEEMLTGSVAEPVTEEAEVGETGPQAASELGVDYDAMRGRIEMTRNRLKAKAFDAMMTGEAALLGRDPANAAGGMPAFADVDSEIIQTIETTLREQDA